MNDDLISRNALKKEFKTIYHCADTYEELAISVEEIINNAPAVEKVDNKNIEAILREIEDLQERNNEKTINWLLTPNGYLYCSNCKWTSSTRERFRFCPNCGFVAEGVDDDE